MSALSRRQFIQIGALSTGAAALGTGCPDIGETRMDWNTLDPADPVDAEVPPDAGDAGPVAPDHADVLNVRLRFEPLEVRIAVGGTVTWRNADQVQHGIQSGSPEAPTSMFRSPYLSPGATFEHRFDTAGRFEYHGYTHPTSERDAFVVVVEVQS